MVNLYPLEPRWRKRRRRGVGERPREPESQSYGHVGPETQNHSIRLGKFSHGREGKHFTLY